MRFLSLSSPLSVIITTSIIIVVIIITTINFCIKIYTDLNFCVSVSKISVSKKCQFVIYKLTCVLCTLNIETAELIGYNPQWKLDRWINC